MVNENPEPDDSEDIKKLNKFIARIVGSISKNFEDAGVKGPAAGITFKIDKDGNLEIGGIENAETQQKPAMPPVPLPQREPAYDLIETGNMLQVVMEMPGIKKEDIRISSNGNMLSVDASNGSKAYRKEFSLPFRVCEKAESSTFNNGVLEIKFKKA
jgi:HSP20 family protein